MLTSIVISKDIIALFGKCQLINCVTDVASLEQMTGIFAGIPAVTKSLDMSEQPVY